MNLFTPLYRRALTAARFRAGLCFSHVRAYQDRSHRIRAWSA